MKAKAYKTVAAAKRAATIAFGKDWAEKYEVLAVNPDTDDDGFDIRLKGVTPDDEEPSDELDSSAGESGESDEAPEPPEPESGDEPEEGATASAFKGDRLRARKANYVKHKHCGDELATALAGVDTGFILGAAQSMGVNVAKWGHLNNGQRRMNVGNVLRTMIKKADDTIRADILAVLRALPRVTRVRVIREGRPYRKFDTQAEADAFIETERAKVKEGEYQPSFKTEVVAA